MMRALSKSTHSRYNPLFQRPSYSLLRASSSLFSTFPSRPSLHSSSRRTIQESFPRYLSSSSKDSFNDVIKKMKNEYDENGEKVTATSAASPAAASGSTEEGKEEDVNESKDFKDENEKKEEEGKENEKAPTDYVQLFNQTLWRSRDLTSSFISGVKETWKELIEGPKESKIRKTVAHAEVIRTKKAKSEEEDEDEDESAAAPYSGPTAVVVSKSKRSTWEEMTARLEDSPLIREMLKNSRKIGRQAADTDLGKQAQKIGEQVTNKIHDAREFWETTQNPLVYKISGAWESLTAPTEEGLAVGEIQRLDPEFRKEDWAEEVKREISPKIIQAHLNGDLKALKPRLGEAVYNKLAADIRTRKADGISIDTRILDIDELQVIIRHLETEGPLILVVYMVQQINCIRNREGEIIEGDENHVVAKFYTMAFKQIFNDEEGTVDWKIVDYELSGGETYF